MKKNTSFFVFCIAMSLILAGCGSKINKEKWTLDKKNQPFPDYVLNSSEKVQETYMMAAKYPEVVAAVPCYCGCVAEGHKSNLDCFVKKMGANNSVEEWDQHGIGCDTCIDIARDAVEMHLEGKSPKDIYHLITEKYNDLGDGTPTSEPK